MLQVAITGVTDNQEAIFFKHQIEDEWYQYITQQIIDGFPSKRLPSRFQNGDQVTLNFYDAGKIINCEVIKVHFTESKVLYDVIVQIPTYEYKGTPQQKVATPIHTRLYNIDSCFVEPADGTNS